MTGEADIVGRAIGLLKAFFRANRHLQSTVLDEAFEGFEKDPRGLLKPDAEPDTFVVDCVTRLLGFGCTDGHRHSLSRLLTVIREQYLGASPPPDYVELPRLLDVDCALPTRDEERAYLEALIEREEARAQLYSPLSASAQAAPESRVAPLLAPWEGHKDIALLLHRPRPAAGEQDQPGDAGTREYHDILAAFDHVPQAALLGAPGAGKSTTLRKLAVDMARRALKDPDAALPLLASLGFWSGDEDLEGFLAQQLPDIGFAAAALAQRRRLILLLDGLNEVPTARRAKKAKQIQVYRRRLPEKTPFIVSCREDDYVGELKLDLDSLSLEPLTPQRVRTVLHHWLPDAAEHMAPGSADRLFWQLAGDERLAGVLQTWLDAGATEEEFWTVSDPGEQKQAYGQTSGAEDVLWREHVPNPRSLLRLAANPFLLTMFYVTWLQNGGALPRNRGELFSGFIDSLLSREGLIHRDPDTDEVQRDERGEALLFGLGEVAALMQRVRDPSDHRGDDESGDADVLTVLPRTEVDAALDTGQKGAGAALLKIAEDASLLEGGAEIRFRHQLLQEHFRCRVHEGAVAGRRHRRLLVLAG
jgi:hypothetical protein